MPSLVLLKMLLQLCRNEDTKLQEGTGFMPNAWKQHRIFAATFRDLQFLNSTADDKNDSVNQRMEENYLGMRSPQVGTVHSLKN